MEALARGPALIYRPPLIQEFQTAARGDDRPTTRQFCVKDALSDG